jgi:hypothetical protein
MNLSLELSRRNFLQAIGVLGLGALSCTPLLKRARLAHAIINQPHPEDYLPVLRSVMGAVLPFEDPAFPGVSREQVEAVLHQHFPLTAPSLRSFQWALLVFNEMDLFTQDLGPVIEEEQNRLRTFDELDERASRGVIEGFSAGEATLYAGFVKAHGSPGRFMDAPLPVQRAYLALWGQSNFTIKRQFYGGAKSIILAAAYSLPALWESIGYDGPLAGGADEG